MLKSRGYTLYEVLFGLVCLLVLAGMVGGVWAIIHFIAKYW